MTVLTSSKPILNIDDIDLMDFGSPGGKFKAKLGRMGPALGAEKLGAMLTIVEPGKVAFPFHVHHAIEEMFFIIEGTGEYRLGEAAYPIRKGDLLAAPTGGPERAHQIINTGGATLKYLAFSTMEDVDIVEYPNSDKILASDRDRTQPMTAQPRVRFISRKESAVDYFDGEDD